MTSSVVSRRTPRGLPFDLAALLAIQLAVFVVGWVGYIGSDDWIYIQNARARMVDPFLVGYDHWDVRVSLTWPMAAAFALFGESEYTAALPTLTYAFLTSATVFVWLHRSVSRLAALGIATLIATSPLLVIAATSLRIDTVETFYVVLSLVLFQWAVHEHSDRWLVAAGIAAALAFCTRPTSIALVVFYGVLFIGRYGIARPRYFLVAAGFVAVWLTESVYYLVTTGHFFHRLSVDFHHDQVVRSSSLVTSVLVEPLRMVFGSHGFGLAFWLLPFAAWYWIRDRAIASERRRIALYMALFSLVWIIVFAGFATKLVLDPRYLAPATVAALVVVGLWVVSLVGEGRRRTAVSIAVVLLGSHAVGLYVENKQFLYSARWLTHLAAAYGTPIYTDPQTYERALFLLELDGVKANVVPAPPPPGALFLSVPENAARGAFNGRRWNSDDYHADGWPVVERFDPARRMLGVLLAAVHADAWLPASQWTKLDHPNPPIDLVRRP